MVARLAPADGRIVPDVAMAVQAVSVRNLVPTPPTALLAERVANCQGQHCEEPHDQNHDTDEHDDFEIHFSSLLGWYRGH